MRRYYYIIILLMILWPAMPARPSYAPPSPFAYKGDGVINIFNTHTGEIEEIKYKDDKGEYLGSGINEINKILRCRLTGKEATMSLRLIELLDDITDHFSAAQVDIISGYRSPELNSSLRASGHKVASKSLHMQGLAVDIRLPGVPLNLIRDYARSLHAGGVGYYSGQFVHVDVGPVRTW